MAEFCPVHVLHSPVLAVLLHGTPTAGSAKLCGVVQGMELRNFAEGATYVRLGGHHVGHRPTF